MKSDDAGRRTALFALYALFAGTCAAQPVPAVPSASQPEVPASTGAASDAVAAPRAAPGNPLRPFAAAAGATAAPWRLALLPNQTKPKTQFSVVDADGSRALRVEAALSYGNLLQPLKVAATPSAKLTWRWKVELLNKSSDLRARGGDDTTLKVCTLWDEPLDKLPFADRQLLRFARAGSSEPVPAATVCYVWDAKLAEGTELNSAFTNRLRYVVLRRGEGNNWVNETRDIAADFARLFGKESPTLPPLVGVAVGADADNTQSRSIGYVADLTLEP